MFLAYFAKNARKNKSTTTSSGRVVTDEVNDYLKRACGESHKEDNLTKHYPSWRRLVPFAMKALREPSAGPIYQFGVFKGGSMRTFLSMMKSGKMSEHFFYGFDSFEGLPDEQDGVGSQANWKKR